MQRKDNAIFRVFMMMSILVIAYWAYEGVMWLWDWYNSSGGYTNDWWPQLGHFLLRNLSIVVVIYGVACMQVSGLAELKFGKNYLVAFSLALILTPPGMMIVYGRKKE